MSLTVKWAYGVAISYKDTQVIFDPQVSNPSYPNIFITHAHYDHSKGFGFADQNKHSTKETLDLYTIKRREIPNWKEIRGNKKFKIGDLEIEAHDAGHILGSVQYETISPEGNLVYTGDLNFVSTLTTKAANVIPCDILVIEATFGSPCIFPSRDQVSMEIVQWTVNSITKEGKIPAFQTDSVGNAQELITILNRLTKIPVVTHPRITAINKVYESFGYKLSYVDARTEEAEELASSHSCAFIVPKRIDLSQNPEFNVAYVSGWASRFSGVRKPFALSDHADFYRLIEYVDKVKPKIVLTCFGGKIVDEIFATNVTKILSIKAKPLMLEKESLPTLTIPPFAQERVNACQREILRAVRIPGFQYTKNWILKQVSQSLREFTKEETKEALDQLTKKGTLRYLYSLDGYELR